MGYLDLARLLIMPKPNFSSKQILIAKFNIKSTNLKVCLKFSLASYLLYW